MPESDKIPAKRPHRVASLLTALTAVVALALPAAAPAVGTVPTPPTHSGTQRMLIPAYFSPGPGGAAWSKMCQQIRDSLAVSLIIMNPPDSGHFTTAEAQYRDGMAACHARGQSVIAYVDTAYATISLNKVKINVDNYLRLYPGVRGVFFDQVPNYATPQHSLAYYSAYYKTLADYVHQRLPGSKVVANAGGSAATDWQFDPPIADILVNFEQTNANFKTWSPKAWVRAYPAASFAHLIYDAPADAQSTWAACASSELKHAGWVFVTAARFGVDLWKRAPSTQMIGCPSLYRRSVIAPST
jgi:hypothetical protein